MRRDREAVRAALQDLQRQDLRRSRCLVASLAEPAQLTRPVVDGRRLVNFSSNDYLGLAGHPRVVEALRGTAQEFGVGSGAAHLVSGHSREHHALEEALAALTGRESALLFSTGYMANLGVITALCDRGDLVLQDRLDHASLIDGALLSGARLARYAHASPQAARSRLEALESRDGHGHGNGHGGDARGVLIATDGLFSMDGDLAPVRELARLAQDAGAWLLVDDAHGLGTLGPGGGGTLALEGLGPLEVPLLVGTLGKAFGCFGAFVAGDADVVELVMQRARSYLFTTALPPAVAAAARAAVALACEEDWRRERLAALVRRFRAGAAAAGIPLLAGGDAAPVATPIQPVVLGDAGSCLRASARLRAAGFWVAPIRPPTVPANGARLRITLSAAHREEEVDALVEALAASLAEEAVAPTRQRA